MRVGFESPTRIARAGRGEARDRGLTTVHQAENPTGPLLDFLSRQDQKTKRGFLMFCVEHGESSALARARAA
jgi:hypothetical protein